MSTSNPDPSHPDPSHPDPSHPDPSHPDPSHPDPSHPDPSHPDASGPGRNGPNDVPPFGVGTPPIRDRSKLRHPCAPPVPHTTAPLVPGPSPLAAALRTGGVDPNGRVARNNTKGTFRWEFPSGRDKIRD
ncbi:hypothetical protein C4J65_02785 [Streptomyces sp. CB09001]|nr:hypothetical protein C4J65_02785 [Streptomyces sp. CB09001]